MTPDLLAEIHAKLRGTYTERGKSRRMWNAMAVCELVAYVDELTRQRDDARRIAIDSGTFQDHRGTDYEHLSQPEPVVLTDAEESSLMAVISDTFVAWDKQIEQP